jgi:hypothetical protein
MPRWLSTVSKWHFRFQDLGGLTFSKGTTVACLVDGETLNGITPAVIDNELKSNF